MFLEPYFTESDGRVSFASAQGSDFAKGLADDFNPLHDTGASRFCVPGDLLFSLLVCKYGVSEHMEVNFSGMVGAEVPLVLPEAAQEMGLCDEKGKQYLQLRRAGETVRDEALAESLCRAYVSFSGHTFPDLLVPLLAERGMMLNPGRPMVMYQSMGIDLSRLDFSTLTLESDHNELDIDGKRGEVRLVFNLLSEGEVVGRGRKTMLLSGLREYVEEEIDVLINRYNEAKASFGSA